MVKALSKVSPPWSVTRTVIGVRGRGLVVEQRAVRDRDRAGGRVDGEAAAGIVGQRVGERRRRHPDRVPVSRADDGAVRRRSPRPTLRRQRGVGRRLVDVGDR